MIKTLREWVVVQDRGLIEIRSPELPPPGTPAEVVVTFEISVQEEAPPPLTSLIGSTRGTFASPEEADAYLHKERASWESFPRRQQSIR